MGPAAGIARHERLVAALQSNDREMILAELESHGNRRFLDAGSDLSSGPVGLAVSVAKR